MPDEKIDQKRPVDVENEAKPIQQRHVDDTVDNSFPASDPPAWTTSASKSVAAECEPDSLNEAPIPPGEGLKGEGRGAAQSRTEQASGLAGDLYRRSQTYLEQSRRYLPEAERMYEQGAQAISRPVREHPLAALLTIGALGCTLGWMLGRRTAGSDPTRQWHPGSNRRPTEPQNWRPAPRAAGHREHHHSSDEAEVASHTNNSF